MSVISERVAKDRAKFISYREAVEKLAAATGDSISDCATALRASKIHFTGGVRFKAGVFIDGGLEEEPLGFLLEQTATTGAIPLCWGIRQEFGPDNIGWRREALLQNLESVGLPAPGSLLSTSPEYAPRPPEAQPLALDERRPETAPAATLDPPSANEAPKGRQRHQESEILRVLRELGHDAKRVPRWKAGKHGVKSEVRRKLSGMTDSVFKKAWERLSAYGDIEYVD